MLFMGKPTISMAIFNSYVSLPEGISYWWESRRNDWVFFQPSLSFHWQEWLETGLGIQPVYRRDIL